MLKRMPTVERERVLRVLHQRYSLPHAGQLPRSMPELSRLFNNAERELLEADAGEGRNVELKTQN